MASAAAAEHEAIDLDEKHFLSKIKKAPAQCETMSVEAADKRKKRFDAVMRFLPGVFSEDTLKKRFFVVRRQLLPLSAYSTTAPDSQVLAWYEWVPAVNLLYDFLFGASTFGASTPCLLKPLTSLCRSCAGS